MLIILIYIEWESYNIIVNIINVNKCFDGKYFVIKNVEIIDNIFYIE